MKHFAYFYFMMDQPDKVGLTVPEHIDYWNKLQLEDYLGGPFQDRTGGLISFSAKDLESAETIVENDPFIREELLERYWLKIWLIE